MAFPPRFLDSLPTVLPFPVVVFATSGECLSLNEAAEQLLQSHPDLGERLAMLEPSSGDSPARIELGDPAQMPSRSFFVHRQQGPDGTWCVMLLDAKLFDSGPTPYEQELVERRRWLGELSREMRAQLSAALRQQQRLLEAPEPQAIQALGEQLRHVLSLLDRAISHDPPEENLKACLVDPREALLQLKARCEVNPRTRGLPLRVELQAMPPTTRIRIEPLHLEQMLDDLVLCVCAEAELSHGIAFSLRIEGEQVVFRVRGQGHRQSAERWSHTALHTMASRYGGEWRLMHEGSNRSPEAVLRLPSVGLVQVPMVVAPLAEATSAQVSPVLVVDDSNDIRDVICYLLRSEGIEAEEAASGEEALSRLLAGDFALAFLDVGLPGLDGYEVARQFFEARPQTRTRLVSLTGLSSRDASERAREVGFWRHLKKPVELDAILQALDERAREPD